MNTQKENSPENSALPFDEYNTSASQTIVLIHGALVTGKSWEPTLRYIPDSFHALVPTLPAHGPSAHIQPFTIARAVEWIAELIKKQARDGHARIVGHSLGASIAIHLASQHPECVQDVFVSGHPNFESSNQSMPFWWWVSLQLEHIIPSPVTRWLMDGTDMPKPDLSIVTRSLCKDIHEELSKATHNVKPWPARTLIVAATKSGILPTGDSVEAAIKLRDIGRESNTETKAFKHPLMRHPFPLQDPKLFIGTAIAWFERREIDSSFEKL